MIYRIGIFVLNVRETKCFQMVGYVFNASLLLIPMSVLMWQIIAGNEFSFI